MADLAKLVVRLEADSLKFQKELDQAKRKLSAFEKAGNQTASVIGKAFGGLAAAVTVGAIAKLAKDAIDLADETSKAAAKIGTTTEALSQLRHAADLAGISNTQLDASLLKLNRNLVEASTNSGSKAAKAFAALGIATRDSDGSIKNADETFEDLADRFAGMEDGAVKTALAMDLFGKSGAGMIPLLNGGAAAIREARAEAEALGLTVSGEAAKSLEQFNDNIDRLGGVIRGSFLQAVQQLAPILESFTNELVEQAKDADLARAGADRLATGFRILLSVGVGVRGVLSEVGILLGGLAAAAGQIDFGRIALKAAGPFGHFAETLALVTTGTTATGQAASVLGQVFADLENEMAANDKLMASVWDETAKGTAAAAATVKTGADTAGAALTAMGENAKRAAQEQASALQTIQAMVQTLQQQTATFEQGEGAVIRYRIAHGDLAATFATAGASADRYKQQLVELTDQLEMQRAEQEAAATVAAEVEARQQRGVQITESLRTAEESRIATLKELNELLGAGAIQQETYNRGVIKADEDFKKTKEAAGQWSDTLEGIAKHAGENIQDSLANFLFDPFAQGTKSMGQQFSDMLRKMAAEIAAAQIMKAVMGGFTTGAQGGGFLGALVSAGSLLFRAHGGPVTAGQPYIVGERGPELMVPSSSGQVVSNREMGGMGGAQVNMTIYTPDADSFRKSGRQVAHGLKRGLNA